RVNVPGSMTTLRTRYLLAMGLPVACASSEHEAPTPVTLPSPSAAAPTPLPKHATYQTEYPRTVSKPLCPTSVAQCYVLSDLGGRACPSTQAVPTGCAPGGSCEDPNAPTIEPLLADVSSQ